MSTGRKTVHRACNLCEAICGITVEVEGRRVISIRGDEADPFSQGYICPKALALQDLQEDGDRLRAPLRREPSGEWTEIGWPEAFDEVAERILAVRGRHGPDALGVYLGNPNVHSLGSLLYGPPLMRSLRTRNRFSATSVDQLPHHLAARYMFGHQLLLPIPDVDRTQYLLTFGANPIASNGSLMTAPDMKGRLRSLRERGGKLVVVDPRRTETAEAADRHLFVRPGTDALVLLSLLWVIFDQGLENLDRLEPWTDQLDRLRAATDGFEPERTAEVTGAPAEEVRRLAREFAGSPSAVCYGRMGVSTQPFGGSCQWLINALNVVTGNLDRAGGALFTLPAVDIVRRFGRGHLGRWHSRVRGLPEFGNELPSSCLAEEIETGGAGRIRALLTVAGNPVLSTPNGGRLERALPRLDFMASVDLYLNETTRHAHLILPPTPPLEREHYDLVFNLLAVRNVAKFSPAAIPAAPGTYSDWQILAELDRRVGRRTPGARLQRGLTRWAGPRRLLDLGLRTGPYGAGVSGLGRGLTLRSLRRHPHGLDLGPLEPSLPDRLRTKDRRIRLAPDELVADLPRLRARLESSATVRSNGRDLRLIGRRHLRSNNSWMHNLPRLVRGRDRCLLLMHPADAAERGLSQGQRVAVTSRAGTVEAPLAISDEMMPGVVSLPHGWGHHRPDTRLETAHDHAGVSVNDVTDDDLVDELCGTAAVNGVPVRVESTTG